jgi:hypothetical protein
MKQRYVLLKLRPQADDLYLILTEPGDFAHEHEPGPDGGCDDCREYYEDKFCAPDLLKAAQAFAQPGEPDPHMLFDFVALVESDTTKEPYKLFQDVLGEPVETVDPENFLEN